MTALLAVLNKQLEAECRMGNHRNLPWRGKQEARQMTADSYSTSRGREVTRQNNIFWAYRPVSATVIKCQ